ncbi:hypothetical protein KXX32_000957, partial [Aspergillus fumigatus]
ANFGFSAKYLDSSEEEDSSPFQMEEAALALLAELPKTCDTIVDAFSKNSRELKAARDELCNAHSELTILKGLLEILFNLLEKMWATVRTYQMGKDMKEEQ